MPPASACRIAIGERVIAVEASDAAEQAWVDAIVRLAVNNQKFLEACTPGYYNNEGRPEQRSARNGQYVQVGAHLMSLVPDQDIWVQASVVGAGSRRNRETSEPTGHGLRGEC